MLIKSMITDRNGLIITIITSEKKILKKLWKEEKVGKNILDRDIV